MFYILFEPNKVCYRSKFGIAISFNKINTEGVLAIA